MHTVIRSGIWVAISIIFLFPAAEHSLCQQHLVAHYYKVKPTIDGRVDDEIWRAAIPIVTHDVDSGVKITLRSIYCDEEIFFLVEFTDADESRVHRPWVWSAEDDMYEVGPEREDCFVFKWFIGRPPKDIRIDSDEMHTADTWFWKAARTDPAGYADDKIQRLSRNQLSKSLQLQSKNGATQYLQRQADEGDAAYLGKVYVNYVQPVMARFESRQPSGSRADVRAKGHWQDGRWAIEFSRKLITGNPDDIQFIPGMRFTFGVSRYEIAGRKPDKSTTQPLYGAGHVSERLVLEFAPKHSGLN